MLDWCLTPGQDPRRVQYSRCYIILIECESSDSITCQNIAVDSIAARDSVNNVLMPLGGNRVASLLQMHRPYQIVIRKIVIIRMYFCQLKALWQITIVAKP